MLMTRSICCSTKRTLHFALLLYLYAYCAFQNKQRLFPRITLTDWPLQLKCNVFAFRWDLVFEILYKPVTAESWVRSQSDHVRFVVDKFALGHVFVRVLSFSYVNIISPVLHTLNS